MVIFAMDLICFINYGWQLLRFVPLTYAVCLDEHVPIRFLVSVERRSWCVVPLNQPFLQSDPRGGYSDVPPQRCSDHCAGPRSPVPAVRDELSCPGKLSVFLIFLLLFFSLLQFLPV